MFDELFEKPLDEAQKIVTEKFNKEGISDEVLDLQVRINTVRNTLNIHDKKEEIYEGFVQ